MTSYENFIKSDTEYKKSVKDVNGAVTDLHFGKKGYENQTQIYIRNWTGDKYCYISKSYGPDYKIVLTYNPEEAQIFMFDYAGSDRLIFYRPQDKKNWRISWSYGNTMPKYSSNLINAWKSKNTESLGVYKWSYFVYDGEFGGNENFLYANYEDMYLHIGHKNEQRTNFQLIDISDINRK